MNICLIVLLQKHGKEVWKLWSILHCKSLLQKMQLQNMYSHDSHTEESTVWTNEYVRFNFILVLFWISMSIFSTLSVKFEQRTMIQSNIGVRIQHDPLNLTQQKRITSKAANNKVCLNYVGKEPLKG